MVKITLVRHAETDDNVNGIISTHSDVPITENGKLQAEELGEELKFEKFTKIYTSDKKRTQQTCRAILSKSVVENLPELVPTELLRERSLGLWDGRPSTDAYAKAKELGVSVREFTPPEGETFEEALKRIETFFNILCELADSKPEENILIVTHGLWVFYFLNHFLVENLDDKYEIENFTSEDLRKPTENTVKSIFTLESKPSGETKRKISFIKVQDCSHLKTQSVFKYRQSVLQKS